MSEGNANKQPVIAQQEYLYIKYNSSFPLLALNYSIKQDKDYNQDSWLMHWLIWLNNPIPV